MLPETLQSKYHEYKKDTDAFLHWLITTGKLHGADAGSSVPRSKRKAKTAAPASPPDGPIKISLADVQRYGQTVAKSSDADKVPRHIYAQAIRAIKLRREVTGWCSENLAEEQSNATHSHFADTLEAILGPLRPIVTVFGRKKPAKKGQSDASQLVNSLANLTIEELSAEVETASSANEASSDDLSSFTYLVQDAETSLEQEEAAFASLCALIDLSDIRVFLLDLWRDYDQGKVDIVQAALTTQIAYELVDRMQNELNLCFPTIVSMEDWISTLRLKAGFTRYAKTKADINWEQLNSLLFGLTIAHAALTMASGLLRTRHFNQIGSLRGSSAGLGLAADRIDEEDLDEEQIKVDSERLFDCGAELLWFFGGDKFEKKINQELTVDLFSLELHHRFAYVPENVKHGTMRDQVFLDSLSREDQSGIQGPNVS